MSQDAYANPYPPADGPAAAARLATEGVAPLARPYTTADGQTWPYPLFYDSCAKVYPATANSIAVYRDAGGGPAQCIGFPPDRDQYRIHSITRQAGANAAAYALINDYEWGLDSYEIRGQTREYCEARAVHGLRFINYCPRALLSSLLRELGPLLWNNDEHRLWIPTLDGRQWTPDELAADIRANWGVVVDPGRIWANQWGQGGPRGSGRVEWDESSLFRDW